MGSSPTRTAPLRAFSAERAYAYRERMTNPPVSGLLFASSKSVVFHEAVDALDSDSPFLYARVSARGRRLRGLKLVMMPLPRPVPNMVLLSTTGGVLRRLGIALNESQRLAVEGDFNTRFTLYCPTEYRADALYVFSPDLLGRLMDAAAGCDVEIVDNRVLIYAPARAFATPEQLAVLPDLVRFLRDKFDRQTSRYRDARRSEAALKDPFRRAQLTSTREGTEQGHVVGSSGNRLRTRTTAWQKVGITCAATLALAAGIYWLSAVASAIF